MDGVFFSEPGCTAYEFHDGLVFVTIKSGTRKITVCTTIHGLRVSAHMATTLLKEIDAEDRRKVCRFREPPAHC